MASRNDDTASSARKPRLSGRYGSSPFMNVNPPVFSYWLSVAFVVVDNVNHALLLASALDYLIVCLV